MPLVRAKPITEGQSPDQGHSPPLIFKMDGGAKPRLTSGGEAATLGTCKYFSKQGPLDC